MSLPNMLNKCHVMSYNGNKWLWKSMTYKCYLGSLLSSGSCGLLGPGSGSFLIDVGCSGGVPVLVKVPDFLMNSERAWMLGLVPKMSGRAMYLDIPQGCFGVCHIWGTLLGCGIWILGLSCHMCSLLGWVRWEGRFS